MDRGRFYKLSSWTGWSSSPTSSIITRVCLHLKVIFKASENTLSGLIRKSCSAAHREQTHFLTNRSFSQTRGPQRDGAELQVYMGTQCSHWTLDPKQHNRPTGLHPGHPAICNCPTHQFQRIDKHIKLHTNVLRCHFLQSRSSPKWGRNVRESPGILSASLPRR